MSGDLSGLSIKELRALNVTAKELATEGHTLSALKATGYSLKELLNAGFTLEECKGAGVDKKLRASGHRLAELKTAVLRPPHAHASPSRRRGRRSRACSIPLPF